MIRRVLIACCFSASLVGFAQLKQIQKKLASMPETEQTALWLCDTALVICTHNPILTQHTAKLALKKADEWNISGLVPAKAHHVLGVSYDARQLPELAIKHYLIALEKYDEMDVKKDIAIIKANMGRAFDDMGHTENAMNYMKESLRISRYQNDSINLDKSIFHLAAGFGKLNLIDSALHFYQECIQVRRAFEDATGIAHVLNNIAELYLSNSEISAEHAQIALIHLKESLTLLKEGDNNNLLATIYANMGKSQLLLGRPTEAERLLKNGLLLADENDFDQVKEQIFGKLSELYNQRGDYKKALEYYGKEILLYKKQRNIEVAKQVDRLTMQYETVRQEKQFAELQRQRALEVGVRNLFFISIVCVILLAIILLFYARQKRKNDEIISQLRLQSLADQINAKNKEISSYTVSFLQKNQLMEELKSQINELKKSADMSTNKELTRINRIVDHNFRSDEEWKTFQLTFDQMHDDFFKS
ncbi:MAG: tetratricopeptide repeat protein [Ekhidna sp.]